MAPFAAGGGGDLLARMLGAKLEQKLGKSFVVENKIGAGGVIGTSAVAKAQPDGYTLLMATSTPMAINVTLYKKLPYDPVADLVPVANVAQVPFILVVNPALPVKIGARADRLREGQSRQAVVRLERRSAPRIICSWNCSSP